MPVNLNSSSLPPTLRGMASVDRYGVPRFWASIWIDVLQPMLEPSTRRKHLTALDRLYEASNRQCGRDCLDRLIAEADADGLENVLLGFLAQGIEYRQVQAEDWSSGKLQYEGFDMATVA